MMSDFDRPQFSTEYNFKPQLPRMDEKQQEDANEKSATQENYYRDDFAKELKLLDHSVVSPTNHSNATGLQAPSESFDNQSEIMNPKHKGLLQLFNEDDRNKLININDQLNTYLDELTSETNDQLGYLSARLANSLGQSISDEMKQFGVKLFEKKRKGGIQDLADLNLPGDKKDDQEPGDSSTGKKEDKENNDNKDDLQMKLDWVRIKKKIRSISDYHPLTLNIDTIFNLPAELNVFDEGQDEKLELNEHLQIIEKQQHEVSKIKRDLKTIIKGNTDIKNVEKFIDNMFLDQMEFDSNVNVKDLVIPQTQNAFLTLGAAGTEPSHNSLNFQEQIEIPDINFFRDLCPFTRQFAKPKLTDERFRRKTQKSILNTNIEIEPSQQNLNEDMYLLAIIGLVPIDKLIKRMNNLSKWEVNDHILEELNQTTDSDEETHNQNETGYFEDEKLTVRGKKKFAISDQLNQERLNRQIKKLTQRKETYQTDEHSDSHKFFEHKKARKFTEPDSIDKGTKKNNLLKILQMKQQEDHSDVLSSPTEKQFSPGLRQKDHFSHFGVGLHLETKDRSVSSGERARKQTESRINPNELSVISEIQQSVVGESMMTNDNLFKSINRGSPSFNQSLENSTQIPLRMRKNEPQKHPIQIDENSSMMQQVNNQESLPHYELQIIQRLDMVDQFIETKRQIEQDLLKAGKKPTQNMKHNERMKHDINKRIEQHLSEIIKMLDTYSSATPDNDDDDEQQVISTDTIQRCIAISNEDVDEQIKTRFFSRILREYRRNKEKSKRDQLRDQMDKEIEVNIYQRFPSLGNSPERNSKGFENQSKQSKQTAANIKSTQQAVKNKINSQILQFKNEKNVNMFEIEEVSQMKHGWGVGGMKKSENKVVKSIQQSMAQKITKIEIQKSQQQQSQQILKPPPLKKINHFKKKKQAKVNEDLDEILPRKKPLKEQLMKYNSSQPLMSLNKKTKGEVTLQNKNKSNKKMQQDMPPDEEQWIGTENEAINISDFNQSDSQWVEHGSKFLFTQ